MAKQINTRIQNKHDIEANWNKATGFIPLAGEIIIYDADEAYNYERFKIGDGETNVINLPFLVDITYNPTSGRAAAGTAIAEALATVATELGNKINIADFITLNEIDTICGTIILDTTVNEVTF